MPKRTAWVVLIGVLLLAAWATPAAQAQSADLSVQTTGPEETIADADIAFSITAANQGPDATDAVTLTDVVPAGSTFVSFAQDSGPAWLCTTPALGAGGTVSCSIATLAAGVTAAFTLTVHVDPGITPGSFISDTASIASATTFDPNDENDASTASTLVGPVTVADVGVTQSAPEGAVPGGDLAYAITVTAGGPPAGFDASLTETLPGATTFVSLDAPDGWTCSTPAVGAGGDVTCTHAALVPGGDERFDLVVHIPPDTPSGTELLNVVTVSTTQLDPNSENDQASTSTIVAAADLGVAMSGPPAARAGDPIAYTITVTNAGPDEANSAQLIDTLPPGLTFLSLTPVAGPAFAASTPAPGQGGTVGLSTALLAAGTSAQFTLEVAIDPTTADQTAITNSATFASPTGDPDPANNATSATITVAGLVADLALASSGPATAAPGATLTYTITLRNDGPDSAYAVALSGATPAHTTFAALAQDDGPPFDLAAPPVGATGAVTATRSQLASGESAAFRLQVVVDPATADGTRIANATAASSAIHDPDPSDDAASVSTAVTIPATSGPTLAPPPAGGAGDDLVACRRVPRLKGKTFRAAKRALERRGCDVTLRRRGRIARASGSHTRVRRQRPRPGATLYAGHTVRVRLR